LSFARNTGILESTGELIAFIDDDAIAEPQFIENAVKFMDADKSVDAIGGKVDPVYNHGEPVWLSKYLWGLVTKTDLGNNVREFPKNTYPKYPAGCNMIFRRFLFGEVGMFNTDLKLRSDDKYIFLELFKYKKKIMYVPTVNVKHHIDDYRLTPEFIKKLSLIVGNSERVRLRNAGLLKNLEKIAEYKFKFFAALILAAGFAFGFEFQKAFYLVKNRWYVLLGFFKKMD
jgi:GT2 family glycosyltransferase